MNNIPHGYDENGVRSGNGNYRENFIQEEEIENLVECFRCGVVMESGSGWSLDVGELCSPCSSEMGLDK